MYDEYEHKKKYLINLFYGPGISMGEFWIAFAVGCAIVVGIVLLS